MAGLLSQGCSESPLAARKTQCILSVLERGIDQLDHISKRGSDPTTACITMGTQFVFLTVHDLLESRVTAESKDAAGCT